MLTRLFGEIRADVAAARDRDPAAQRVSSFVILTTWAGVQALLAHRAAHALHGARVPLVPRVIAYLTRMVTGSRSIPPPISATASSSTTAPAW